MLNHSPKERPAAVEARKKYKEFVEIMASNPIVDLMEDWILGLGIGSKPMMKRNRIVRRNRFRRHRNVIGHITAFET